MGKLTRQRKKRSMILILLLMFAVLVSSCNRSLGLLPDRIYNFIYFAEPTQSLFDEMMEAPFYPSTPLSASPKENGQQNPQAELPEGLVEHLTWQCRDVAGEISALESSSEVTTYGIKGLKIISTELDLSFSITDWKDLFVNFQLKVERDEAVIDSDTETITAWNHVEWTKDGVTKALISENGAFSDVLEVSLIQRWTYPNSASRESTESHAFFGLIPLENINHAYLCDRRANPIPEGLIDLTPANFRNYCNPGYYYECDLK